jgi:hypothetical protein
MQEQTTIPQKSDFLPLPPLSIPAKESNKRIIIIGTLVGLCVCLSVCGIIFGTQIAKAIKEKPEVESVIDQHMRAMADRDVNAAYELFSTRSKKNFPISKLESFLEGNNFVLYKGYQRVSITTISLLATANTNQDLPQGTVAKAAGTVSYAGGFTGQFSAILEQENGEWRIYNFNVTVPPDKFVP